jgi:hypothetical protein
MSRCGADRTMMTPTGAVHKLLVVAQPRVVAAWYRVVRAVTRGAELRRRPCTLGESFGQERLPGDVKQLHDVPGFLESRAGLRSDC